MAVYNCWGDDPNFGRGRSQEKQDESKETDGKILTVIVLVFLAGLAFYVMRALIQA